jgi:uncharacterized protein
VTRLLDANVLIALVVADHIHHTFAEAWLDGHDDFFATCPITEGSLVRFLLREGQSGTAALTMLTKLAAHSRHTFWADSVSYRDVPLGTLIGHRQATDAYLVRLAQEHDCRLATFDQGLAALFPDRVELISTD